MTLTLGMALASMSGDRVNKKYDKNIDTEKRKHFVFIFEQSSKTIKEI